MRLFSAPEIFIPHAYGTKNRRRQPSPENGVDLWRRFLERVSWVLAYTLLVCHSSEEPLGLGFPTQHTDRHP